MLPNKQRKSQPIDTQTCALCGDIVDAWDEYDVNVWLCGDCWVLTVDLETAGGLPY
jgi:hypothetical protein